MARSETGALSLPEIGIDLIPQLQYKGPFSTWERAEAADAAAQRIIDAGGDRLYSRGYNLVRMDAGKDAPLTPEDTPPPLYAICFWGPNKTGLWAKRVEA